jgi:hypothetical protein
MSKPEDTELYRTGYAQGQEDAIWGERARLKVRAERLRKMGVELGAPGPNSYEPRNPHLRIHFANTRAARHFKTWLCESGEQAYWGWMEFRESEEDGDITAVSFDYQGQEIIKTKCGRLTDEDPVILPPGAADHPLTKLEGKLADALLEAKIILLMLDNKAMSIPDMCAELEKDGIEKDEAEGAIAGMIEEGKVAFGTDCLLRTKGRTGE